MVEHPVTSKDIDGISLIGFRIDPDSESPDIYTLMAYGAREVLLVVNGQILFFRSPSSVKVAYDFFGEDVKNLASVPSEIDAIFDLAAALHTINHQDIDESAEVIDCLNMLFDLVAATQTAMPAAYKKLLYGLADHLTFERNLGEYLTRLDLKRAEITDAVLWCVGAIVVNSKVLDSNGTWIKVIGEIVVECRS